MAGNFPAEAIFLAKAHSGSTSFGERAHQLARRSAEPAEPVEPGDAARMWHFNKR